MKRTALTVGIILFVILAACNLPGQISATEIPGLAGTQAAQTVAAELTRVAGQVTDTPVPPAPPTLTFTPPPTNTPVSTSTNTPLPCNRAVFVTDVTIPDNTVIPPGGAFTKTWRLQNTGTCAWNSSYQLVFMNGDPLGVAGGYAQPLTSGVVSPGQDVDVSVNLTAPMAQGTYTGRWGFREPSGSTIFTTFIVVIKVPAPTAHTVTLNSIGAEGGSVRGDGTVLPSVPNAGDTEAAIGSEAFLSFDISGIPNNATITQVQMDLSGGYDTLGSPFSALGCFKIYPQNYVLPLAAGAFVGGAAPANFDHQWCSLADVNTVQTDNDFKNDVQARLGASTRVQFRFQASSVTNHDAVADMVRLGTAKLIVTYTTP